MKSLKFFVLVVVAVAMLTACSGVSQEQYNQLVNQQATQSALLEKLVETPVLASTQESTTKVTPSVTPTATALNPSVTPTTAQAKVEVQPGNPGACPVDSEVKLVYPGYNSPNDLNRLSAGTEWVSVCFPNGGGVLASYIVIEGKTFDDVLKCDRDNKPTEICGYLLNVPKGIVVKYHDGVGGTLFPDANGEMYEADGVTLHPWLRNITAEVFPLPAK